jgi:hypothetical protein
MSKKGDRLRGQGRRIADQRRQHPGRAMPPNFDCVPLIGQFFGQLGQFKRLDDCDVRWEPGADKKENLALRVLWDLLGGRRLRPIGLVPVTSRCRSSLRGRVRS